MLRHADNLPVKKSNNKVHSEDFNDRQIAELMFHMEELRGGCLSGVLNPISIVVM